MYRWCLSLVLALLTAACGGSNNACAIEEQSCDGTCTDTLADPANCGACGVTCAAGETCNGGVCQVPCDASRLMAPIEDPWGTTWDGLERTAATLDAANLDCATFGGRLPTATEVYRVSASRTGAVGQAFHTNYLWTRTANDRVSQVTTRLSDGGTSAATAATPTMASYRCVCPAAVPRHFASSRCNGPAGSECFRWGAYHIDKEDRPALRKSAAIQECVAEHAHLADLPQLGAAISAGLPGSGEFIGTADGSRYDMTTWIRWSTARWELGGIVDPMTVPTQHQKPVPFRCAAPAFPASPGGTPVSNAFLPPLSSYKGETTDRPTAGWTTAHDTCWRMGGHLPRTTELAELVGQGLPGGTDQFLWTADQLGYNGSQFLAAVLRWNGLDRRFPFEYTGGADSTVTEGVKTDAGRPFRCIYYPIDPMFQPPATCNGGCNVRSAGSPSVTIFFDQTDRAPATLADAIADCGQAGGYLASARDLTEAIRDGLPNGSGSYLHTLDLVLGNLTVNYSITVRWVGVNRAYDDQWDGTTSANTTWDNPMIAHPYRCMWTNELR